MDSGAKGERYARIFRKAGVYLAKGNVARALEVLKEGRDLADSEGHAKMARLFEAEMERAKRPSIPKRDRQTKQTMTAAPGAVFGALEVPEGSKAALAVRVCCRCSIVHRLTACSSCLPSV
jgi:hypothetical protein